MKTLSGGTRIRVVLACAVIPAAFVLVLASWHWRAPDDVHVAGLFQGDMATYLCNARMAAEHLGVAYASPYDVRDSARSVFVQLPISLLGLLLRLGLEPPWATQGLRLLFGFGMFLAVAALLRRIFPEERWFWPSFLVVSLGGGFAWLVALVATPSFGIQQVEAGYYWWFLNVFRNLAYPLETIYHAVLFAHLLALATGRWGVANSLLLVAALSNPFLTVQMAGVHVVCAVAGPGARTQRALGVPILALFGVYYGLLLPLDPIGGVLRDAHAEAYRAPLAFADMAVAYGPALLVLPILIFDRAFRARVVQDRNTLPVLALTLWTLILVHHSRIPGAASAQPMHFTRGYLFFGLWVLLLVWLRGLDLPPRLRGPGAALAASILLVAVTLPDNLAFVRDRSRVKLQHTFVWSQPTEALLENLREISPPMRVLTLGEHLGARICAFTRHRPLIGTRYTTPGFAERVQASRRFLANPASDEPIAGYGVEAVVISVREGATVERLRAAEAWMRVFKNSEWAIFRRVDRRLAPMPGRALKKVPVKRPNLP